MLTLATNPTIILSRGKFSTAFGDHGHGPGGGGRSRYELMPASTHANLAISPFLECEIVVCTKVETFSKAMSVCNYQQSFGKFEPLL